MAMAMKQMVTLGDSEAELAAAAETAAAAAEELAAAAQMKLQAYEDSRPKPMGVFGPYISLGDAAHKFVNGRIFGVLINLCILITCVYVAMNTYDQFKHDPTLVTLDEVLSVIFMLEVALKIVAETTRPWKYFYGNPHWGWNCFDCFITMLTIPWLPMPPRLRQIGQTARVMRIVKLLRKAKQVQVIVSALISGGKAIFVIFMLLVLVWILYVAPSPAPHSVLSRALRNLPPPPPTTTTTTAPTPHPKVRHAGHDIPRSQR
jgi:phosphatidylglycerophosphatase A